MTVDEVQDWQQKLQMADVASLQTLVSGEDQNDLEMIETLISDDVTTDPVETVISNDRTRRFRRAVDDLPDRERQVAVLRYVQELTLSEIGEVMGVSESRVSQLDTRLKDLLREDLAPAGAPV
jgi:RNA polymerase sigma factor for flagellar operon FliA